MTELAELNVVGASGKVDETSTVPGFVIDCIEDGDGVSVASAETGTNEPKLFEIDAVAAVALMSLHRAYAMLRVSSTSSSQGS